MSNGEYLYNFLGEKLSMMFPNVPKNATFEKVSNWFRETDEKLFESEIEDYLVMINRYSAAEGN